MAYVTRKDIHPYEAVRINSSTQRRHSMCDGIEDTGLYRVDYSIGGSRWELWEVAKGEKRCVGFATARHHAEDMWDEFVFMRDVNLTSIHDLDLEDIIIH